MPRYDDEDPGYRRDEHYRWEAGLDEEDYLRSRTLSRRIREYDRKYAELDDGMWYWHVFLHGERVNGGLSETHDDARADSARAIAMHASSPPS